MEQPNEKHIISEIIPLIKALILLLFFQFVIVFVFKTFGFEQIDSEFAYFFLKFKTISTWIIYIFIFINICLTGYRIIYSNKKGKEWGAHESVAKPVSVSNALKNKQEKSNSSINLDVQKLKKTIFRPNVDEILSMIQYIEDLQKQIKNSSNINKRNKIALSSALQSPLSNIDQSIFVKFNILKENFTLDYQAVDWNSETNTNQEISNFYQKIYDKHQDLLQAEYSNIKTYLKDYFDRQAIKSEERLDLIKKIID